VLASLARRHWRSPVTAIPLVGAVTGMPLVAAGITFSRPLEWLGAWWLALCALVLAFAQVRLALASGCWLLGLSGLSLVGGMLLAGTYALAHYLGAPWIDIQQMLPTHGVLNALGFSLCGLLSWRGIAANS
jgi:hypothetical protein